ncbi:MAG: c-type cytochrome [Bacteroidota bacterium]|nr:c-type cytochrome [Bacteroidota bacterium]
MRILVVILPAIAAIITVAVVACTNSAPETKKETAALDSTGLVKRGDYLVNSMGCDDCHSPKRMGPKGPELISELRLSGFPSKGQLPPGDSTAVKNGWMLMAPDLTAAVGPWGISFAGNLTSDATGIGNWTEENFIRAIRKGKLKGMEQGRDLLPPMPWTIYKNLTDEDLKSIFAYLKTIPPVDNVVPAPKALSELKY